jgi:hypothetical protein
MTLTKVRLSIINNYTSKYLLTVEYSALSVPPRIYITCIWAQILIFKCKLYFIYRRWDRVCGMVTMLQGGQPRNYEFISSPKFLDQLWTPHSLLFNGYEGLLLGGKLDMARSQPLTSI